MYYIYVMEFLYTNFDIDQTCLLMNIENMIFLKTHEQ